MPAQPHCGAGPARRGPAEQQAADHAAVAAAGDQHSGGGGRRGRRRAAAAGGDVHVVCGAWASRHSGGRPCSISTWDALPPSAGTQPQRRHGGCNDPRLGSHSTAWLGSGFVSVNFFPKMRVSGSVTFFDVASICVTSICGIHS